MALSRNVLASGSAILLVVIVGAYLLIRHPAAEPSPDVFGQATAAGFFSSHIASATTSASSDAPAAPPGTTAYTNSAYHFSLFYPHDLKTSLHDEGGGASTLTFEDDKTAQGFQIFITPFSGTQVDKNRFMRDEPSGVMQSPTTLSIDGALATMFFGSDATLGPTREVWFIYNGFLFEVTAPQSLDDWLGAIMQTWHWL